jgi:1-carboxybiuret hydrolase subunit AtzG-like protein
MAKKDDTLDEFIEAAARALSLPIEPEWKAAIRANLEATLKHAALVDEFPLPDEAEPAPVFKA